MASIIMIKPPFHARLCVSSLLWRRRSMHEVAEAMMRLKLRLLELSSAPVAPLHYQPGGDNGALFNLMAEAGVRVAALRLTGMTFEQKIRAIADAGARGVPAVLDRVERLNFPDLVDRVRVYALCAQREGTQFILENDYHSSCDNAQAQLSLERIVSQPTLGFGFAPPHAVADNLDPREEVLALGPRLSVAYLWDASTKMKVSRWGARLDPGPPEEQRPGNDQGRVDWEAYFRALAEVRFRGLFTLRWRGAEDWPAWQLESAILDSIDFCAEVAGRTGFA